MIKNQKTKTVVFLALLFFAIIGQTNAQVNLRHVTGLKYIGLSGAYVPDGINLGANYGFYLKRNMGLEFSGFFEKGNANLGNFSLYYFQPEFFLTVGHINHFLFVNIKLGGIAGYEIVENKILALKEENFQWGFESGLKVEIYLANNIKIDFNVEPRYLPKRQTGVFDIKAGFGMSYNF